MTWPTGGSHVFEPVVFGLERGVGEANFGSPAGFADAKGVLWFGTIEGAVRIDSTAFPFNATPPPVSIDAISADGQPLLAGSVVTVPALTARVRLDLAGAGLLYPELTRFRFRVEGVDSDWVDMGPQRTLIWTPPGPGRYRLAFAARNEDGVWSQAPAVVDLDVRAAWWQTGTVRVFGALGTLLVVASGYRWRVRRLERRHADELRRLEEQRAAAERITSLREQLEHVSRVALLGELAASLAHEVRQPIGAMVNNAEAGRRHLAKYLQRPDDIEAIFNDIVADGMRASEIVRGMRSFLRPHDAASAPVDLSDLVREMLPLVRRELKDHRVDVELRLAADLPMVDAVPVQMGQVLVNLVMNACEALAAVAGPRRVTVATASRDGRVELDVTDNGPGPSPELAPADLRALRHHEARGTRYGPRDLPIDCRGARRPAGRRRPRQRWVSRDPVPAGPRRVESRIMISTPTVYVVEDDASMRASLARLLGDAGYRLTMHASAEALLAEASPDLAGCALLDLRLPGMSGLELQARLVEKGCLLPVMFLTAHGDLPAGVQAMKQGAVDFLEKPVVADALFGASARRAGARSGCEADAPRPGGHGGARGAA